MWSKLKPELTAGVAVSGAMLLGAGYLFVWAQLANENLPAQPILSALPTTFFVSAAVQSVGVPLIVVLTLPGAVLAFSARRAFPSVVWWIAFGVGLALAARAVTLADVRLVTGSTAQTLVSVLVAVAVIAVSAFLGGVAERLLPSEADASRVLQAMAAVMLVLTVAAVSAFRIADARTVDRPLPYVGVFLDTEDCPAVFDVFRRPLASKVTAQSNADPQPPSEAKMVEEKRCFVGGLYVGESDQWMFVAKRPEPDRAPGRLLLVPRDAAQLGTTANSPLNAGGS